MKMQLRIKNLTSPLLQYIQVQEGLKKMKISGLNILNRSIGNMAMTITTKRTKCQWAWYGHGSGGGFM